MWRERARERYSARSQAGDLRAMNVLGSMYWLDKDVRSAELWYRKAAEAGMVEGMYMLGLLYGSTGSGRDDRGQRYMVPGQADTHREALEWHRKAAQAGHPLPAKIAENLPR